MLVPVVEEVRGVFFNFDLALRVQSEAVIYSVDEQLVEI